MAKNSASGASSVAIYFCAESDLLQQRRPSASSSDAANSLQSASSAKDRLQRAVAAAAGSTKVDSTGKRIYYTGKDCFKVRRTMEVDGLIQDTEARESVFNKCLARRIDGVIEQARDVVLLVGGNSGTDKTKLLHGDTLDPTDSGDAMPPRERWGLACFVVERLLAASAKLRSEQGEGVEIMATAAKIHLDHVADVLVSVQGSRMTKSESKNARNQCSKLLLLSKGVTLDVEEGAEGHFAITDQLDSPIREIDDFVHVINCMAALNAGRGTFLRLGKKTANPFHVVTTLRIWRREQSPNFIHIVEMADFDWTGGEEETAAFRQSIASVADICKLLQQRDYVNVKSRVRDCTLTRIVHSSLSFQGSDTVVFGLAHTSQCLEMMGYLSSCKGAPITIVLHGPDGEGEDDVDPELKQHVVEVQRQCEELKADVARLEDEKKGLAEQLKAGEENVSRLQQQCATVRKLTASTSPTHHHNGANQLGTTARTANNNGQQQQHSDSPEAFSISGPRPATPRAVGFSPLELQRRRLSHLELDLKLMKEDDQRRVDACQRQIQFMIEERNRCATKTQALQKEYDLLKGKLADIEATIAKEKQAKEAEMQQRIAEAIDHSRNEAESHNRGQRELIQRAQQLAQLQQERDIVREEVMERELHSVASALDVTMAKEATAWDAEHAALLRELEAATAERVALEGELQSVSYQHKTYTEALDEETRVVSRYAEELSAALVRFECHNSSAKKRLVTFPSCGVVLYVPTLKHPTEWMVKQCMAMRTWLDARGYPRPVAYCNVENGHVELLDPERAAVAPSKVEARAAAAETVEAGVPAPSVAAEPSPTPGRDLTGTMYETLSRQNHSLRIALQARERLVEMQLRKAVGSANNGNTGSSRLRPASAFVGNRGQRN